MENEKKLKDIVKNKCNKQRWVVSEKCVEDWVRKTSKILTLYNTVQTDGLANFKLEEILHYLTIEDIKTCTVGLKRDETLLQELFKENQIAKLASARETEMLSGIKTPEETFQQKIEGVMCPMCKSTKGTITYARQARSADEPTDYFGECSGTDEKRCKYVWKIK